VNTETTTPDPIHDALAKAYDEMLSVICAVTPAQAERLGLFDMADDIACNLGGDGCEPLSDGARDDLLSIGKLLLEAARESLGDSRAPSLLYARQRLIDRATRNLADDDDGVHF
jgi:hypothetical protein